MKPSLVLGTRGSKLALAQTNLVKSSLQRRYPELEVSIFIIKTTGDKLAEHALTKIAGKGVFVKEIEEALLEGKIDVAVHSMKDLPTDMSEELTIAAVLKRKEYRDAFVSQKYTSIASLPKHATVGTSSFRRSIQVLRKRSDLSIRDIRGNVETRIKKMDDGEYEAIILSAAGMKRLGLSNRITELLDFYPAVGQGALALQVRTDDTKTKEKILFLNNKDDFLCTQMERLFLKEMGGGCQSPVGAYATIEGQAFFLRVFIGSLDAKQFLEHKEQSFLKDAERCVLSCSKTLIESGGKEILEKTRYAP